MVEPVPQSLVGRPFRRAEALNAGVTGRMLNHRRFRSPTRGVWTAVDDPARRFRVDVAAVLKILPSDTVATGVTGLQVVGVDLGTPAPLRFCSTHPHPVRRPGVRVTRVTELPPHDRWLATPVSCFTAAAELGLVDLVAAGDWLVRLGLTTTADLRTAAIPGRRGAPVVRRAGALVRDRVESPKETELRLVLVLAGLPEPRCNCDVGDAERRLARGDLVFEEYGVIVEYDGLQHLTSRRQWEHDVVRLEQLARAGWVVIRVTAARLRRPEALVSDVAAALTQGGWTGHPRLTPEWRSLFGR